MDFTISYEPAPDEVTRAGLLGLKRQLNTISWVLIATLIAGGAVLMVTAGGVVGPALLISAVVVRPVMSWSLRRSVRRALAHMCVPATLRMTGDGYEVRTDDYTTTMRWSMFTEVVDTPEFWLFFVGKKQFAAFLPKRAFDDGQRAELGAVLAAHTGR